MIALAGLLLFGTLSAEAAGAGIVGEAAVATETAAARQRRAAYEHCGEVLRSVEPVTDAQPLLAPAELRERLRESLRAAGKLESRRIDGESMTLPWIAETERGLAEAADAEAGARLAGRFYDRLFETCRRLGLGDFPETVADQRLLRSILSRPEYDLRNREDFVLFRLLESLRTWLRDVFALNPGVQKVALSFRVVFLVSVCLLAAWLALRAGRRASRRRASRARATGAEVPVLGSPVDYRQGAERAIADADGREAVRLALLTLLATLERLRLAAPGRAATNREVAEQIAARGGSSELSRATRDVVDWYDRAWYGLAAVGHEQARGFLARIEALCERAGTEARRRREGA